MIITCIYNTLATSIFRDGMTTEFLNYYKALTLVQKKRMDDNCNITRYVLFCMEMKFGF
jgi:hypothetical protein